MLEAVWLVTLTQLHGAESCHTTYPAQVERVLIAGRFFGQCFKVLICEVLRDQFHSYRSPYDNFWCVLHFPEVMFSGRFRAPGHYM